MRLLQLGAEGELTLTRDLLDNIPPYAILSHTWGTGPNDEVTFQDIGGKRGEEKPGYQKILFCGRQAQQDDLEYFWVDTCCIDKASSAELTEAINSMFRWYQNAQKCYVYLADVSYGDSASDEPARSTWKSEFRKSRWFTRGWTLQELIAPRTIDFFSKDEQWLGNKQSLEITVHEITQIPNHVLQSASVSDFDFDERLAWSENRKTTRVEDKAYSLLGIFDVSMPVIYGEGEELALRRLRAEFSARSAKASVLALLPIVNDAVYDSHINEHNAQCLPDTRTDVLREITEWAYNPHSKTVYWLNGIAGTGKSTISRTIAQGFSGSGILGATFFFKRGEGDRGGLSKFFSTIASQLVQQLPEIAGHMQSVIEADPSIGSKAMRQQFQRLIIDPVLKISASAGQFRISVIIVDALDECEPEEDIRLLIDLLSSARTIKNLQLKFILTSRPELPIRLGFNSVSGTYQDFVLHEVAELVIEHDLVVYFRHSLGRVRTDFNQTTSEERHLSISWPSEADLRALVQMAIPLFIFAATVCRFVADRKGGNPGKKLQRVLEFQSTQGSRLIATYKPVLEQLTLNLPLGEQEEILCQFHKLVGPIAILANPLPLESLAGLLDIPASDILEILDFLHSVLHVPSSPKQPIRLLHLSFRDFLVDPIRREDPFWINEHKVHQQLANHCIRILSSSLKPDICNVVAPGILASSISAVEVGTHISAELQYASRFRVYHLHESLPSALDIRSIWRFLSSRFLQWLEALSWMGRLRESLVMIESLLSTLSVRSGR